MCAIVCDLCLPTRTPHFRWRSAIKSVKNVFQILLCVRRFDSSKIIITISPNLKKQSDEVPFNFLLASIVISFFFLALWNEEIVCIKIFDFNLDFIVPR